MVNYISDVELTSLLQKMSNGTAVNDIPEFNSYLDQSHIKRRRLSYEIRPMQRHTEDTI